MSDYGQYASSIRGGNFNPFLHKWLDLGYVLSQKGQIKSLKGNGSSESTVSKIVCIQLDR